VFAAAAAAAAGWAGQLDMFAWGAAREIAFSAFKFDSYLNEFP
jgi:hypothetical protein